MMKETTTGRWLTQRGALVSLVLGLFAALLLSETLAAQEKSWQPLAPMLQERFEHACALVGDTFYVFGGYGKGVKTSNHVRAFDLAKNKWRRLQDMPSTITHVNTVVDGRFIWDDAAQTPNAHIMYYDFPTAPIVHEIYNVSAPSTFFDMLITFKTKGTREELLLRRGPYGLIVECEEGVVLTQTYQAHRTSVAYDRKGREIKTFSDRDDHFVNFIQAVRNGRREDLNAEVEEGHISTASAHTSNISYRVGEVASVKQQLAQIDGIPGFKALYDRFQMILKDHGVDPNTATLGVWLEIDRKKERIKNNDGANKLLVGSYRESFNVPDLSS